MPHGCLESSPTCTLWLSWGEIMVGHIQSHVDCVYRARGDTASVGALGHSAIAWVVAATDFIFLLAASAAGFVLYEELTFDSDADPFRYVGIGLVMAMSFVLAMHSARAYRPETILLHRFQIRIICILIPATLAFLLTVIFFLKLGASLSRGSIVVATGMSISGLVGLRYFWRWILPHALARGTFGRRRVLLICGEEFPVWQFQATASHVGTSVTEVVRLSDDGLLPTWWFESIVTKPQGHVDEIVMIWRDADTAKLEDHLTRLRRSTLPVSVAFEGVVGTVVSGSVRRIGDLAAFQTQRPPFSFLESALKRLFDICFSSMTLIALSPMMLLVAVAIKLDSKGPVFFFQTRKGYGGRTFRIVKFRSMRVLEDGPQLRQATRSDLRVTRVGAFIRSTSIDELPQFWNILKGDMSVVGPRPHALAHDDFYDAQIGRYIFRRHVKPGLTGWAQVNNCRGETPDIERMEERVAHDLWYINNWSMMLDFKIICRTAFQLHDTGAVY